MLSTATLRACIVAYVFGFIPLTAKDATMLRPSWLVKYKVILRIARALTLLSLFLLSKAEAD